MIRLAKLIAILAAFRFFVFDLIKPNLELTNAAQITAIIGIALVAMMFAIVFVIRK